MTQYISNLRFERLVFISVTPNLPVVETVLRAATCHPIKYVEVSNQIHMDVSS